MFGQVSNLLFRTLALLSWAGLSSAALAQETEQDAASKDAILVLDASGSMWGQIDGINKIVIAKDVVEGLVRSLPQTQRLGMVAYGHRKKGDCTDIETLADVGADRAKVIEQIRKLSPKGKTPLSKSVEHAAKALNYKKNAATVILVSDGLETCEADPCALAKTLEENGLDFTVHVIGFDVTEEERGGLSCIAEETGGEFLAADNADELTDALSQVAIAEEAVEPVEETSDPDPQTVALKATILQNGPDIQSKLNWLVTPKDGGEPVFQKDNAGYVDFEVVPGDYIARATWTGWPHQGERVGGNKVGTKEFTIVASRPAVVTVPIDLGIPVTLEADPQIAEGNPVNISWTGPDDLGAYITVNRLDDGPRDEIYFTPAQRARDAYQTEAEKDGSDIAALDTSGDGTFNQDDVAKTQVAGPSVEGDYEVRYVLADPRLILARVPLTVTDSNYTVSAPAEVPAGSKFQVTWTGPATDGDFITMEKAGLKTAFSPGGNARLKQGEPAELTAFGEPGDYEVRYVLANSYTTYEGMQHAVQASVPVKVLPVEASVSGPAEIIGGSMITVDVTPVAGEEWKDDYVSIIQTGATKYNRDSWQSLGKGNADGTQVEFQAPNIDGDYEIAYFLAPGDTVLARQPLKVTRAAATVEAPDTVKVGESFEVTYSGPNYKGDRVVLVAADKSDTSMFNATPAYGFFAKEGETVGTISERNTSKPGEYEVRYTTGFQHQVLARDKVTVIE